MSEILTEASAMPAFYSWWDQVPGHLKTKTQLAEAGLKPGAAACATIAYGRGRRARCYDLYDTAQAQPKMPATAAQLAALEKGRTKQKTCRRCGWVAQSTAHLQHGLCLDCVEADERREHAGNRDAAIVWARQHVSGAGFLVLDTETTGLAGELVEIAVLHPDGSPALDTLIQPRGEMGATEIHGITADMVCEAPSFAEIEPRLRELLTGRTVIVYNASFDRSILAGELYSLGRQRCEAASNGEVFPWRDWTQDVRWECLMEAYAPYYGEWHEYFRSYTWQPLGGDHRAKGDCAAALGLLNQMAASPLSTEATEPDQGTDEREKLT